MFCQLFALSGCEAGRELWRGAYLYDAAEGSRPRPLCAVGDTLYALCADLHRSKHIPAFAPFVKALWKELARIEVNVQNPGETSPDPQEIGVEPV
jgi:hypothetical protein